MEHSPTSATGHRVGTHAVARDAAGARGLSEHPRQAKKEALANGAFAFISQPVNLAELDEALKKVEEGKR